MKAKNTQGVLVREYTNTKVACTCGRGNTHFHNSGSGIIKIPLAQNKFRAPWVAVNRNPQTTFDKKMDEEKLSKG